jgi:hypothetical protein
MTAEVAAAITRLAMDAFDVVGEYNPASASAGAGASASGDRDKAASASASASTCAPAALCYKGTLVNVSIAKNNKIQVTARIAGKNHHVLELESADLPTGICTANAVAVPLERSLKDGECRTAAVARKMAKDTLAALDSDSDSAARAARGCGSSPFTVVGEYNPASVRASAGASSSNDRARAASASGDIDPVEHQQRYQQSFDRVCAQCPNLVTSSSAFADVPLAAHPQRPTTAKYSYTLERPEHVCKIIVNLQKSSYYVTNAGTVPPSVSASASLTVDGRGGVLISWGRPWGRWGRHGGADSAFQLAQQVARW